jgi:hypothetical protein
MSKWPNGQMSKCHDIIEGVKGRQSYSKPYGTTCRRQKPLQDIRKRRIFLKVVLTVFLSVFVFVAPADIFTLI